MSTKIVRYKDVCDVMIPVIADMIENGNIEPAINALKALGSLEDVDLEKDADLAKAVKGHCKSQLWQCTSCKYYDIGGYKGCIFTHGDMTPEEWQI